MTISLKATLLQFMNQLEVASSEKNEFNDIKALLNQTDTTIAETAQGKAQVAQFVNILLDEFPMLLSSKKNKQLAASFLQQIQSERQEQKPAKK